MLGKELDDEEEIKDDSLVYQGADADQNVFEAEGLQSNAGIKPFNFHIKKGEVNGFAGLLGSGRSECVRAIFGADKVIAGKVKIKGKRCENFQADRCYETWHLHIFLKAVKMTALSEISFRTRQYYPCTAGTERIFPSVLKERGHIRLQMNISSFLKSRQLLQIHRSNHFPVVISRNVSLRGGC